MQKVVYSITKVNKDEKLKGVGYLVEGNLLIPSTSSKGNAYIRVFEDVAEKCKPVKDSEEKLWKSKQSNCLKKKQRTKNIWRTTRNERI